MPQPNNEKQRTNVTLNANNLGNYMRKCASGGQSLANAERGVGMSGFAGKIGD